MWGREQAGKAAVMGGQWAGGSQTADPVRTLPPGMRQSLRAALVEWNRPLSQPGPGTRGQWGKQHLRMFQSRKRRRKTQRVVDLEGSHPDTEAPEGRRDEVKSPAESVTQLVGVKHVRTRITPQNPRLSATIFPRTPRAPVSNLIISFDFKFHSIHLIPQRKHPRMPVSALRVGDAYTSEVWAHPPQKHAWRVSITSKTGDPEMGGHPRWDLQEKGREARLGT